METTCCTRTFVTLAVTLHVLRLTNTIHYTDDCFQHANYLNLELPKFTLVSRIVKPENKKVQALSPYLNVVKSVVAIPAKTRRTTNSAQRQIKLEEQFIELSMYQNKNNLATAQYSRTNTKAREIARKAKNTRKYKRDEKIVINQKWRREG